MSSWLAEMMSVSAFFRHPTDKPYHYDSDDQLRQHLQVFIDAYNHGRRLKTLRGLTPYEYVARVWTDDPTRLKVNPYRYTSRLNT